MATKDEQGRWIDATGNAVPVKYIDPVEKRRDRMVEKLFTRASRTQEQLAKFKALVMQEIESYLEWLAGEYGEEALNKVGNYTLNGFSGNKRVILKVNKHIEFDERLILAKQKIDRCFERWSDGANSNLKVVIFDAFNVDKKGNLDTRRILKLRKLEIRDPEWREAMDLITKAITFSSSKNYIFFQVRDQDENWQTIRLDLAGV